MSEPIQALGGNPTYHFIGDPCRRGHPGLRYRKDKVCVHCVREKNTQERAAARVAEITTRACRWCGGPIAPELHLGAVFCSAECRSAHWVHQRVHAAHTRRRERICHRCKEAIPPERKQAVKYCSERCCREDKRPTGEVRNRRARADRLKNRRSWLIREIRQRSRKLGIPFDLTPDDIVFVDTCPVMGVPLDWNVSGNPQHNSPSVDRIRPNLGYTKGNIRVISQRANSLKTNATSAEMELVLADLKRLGL